MCIISRQPWTVWRLDTPSKGVFFACGKWPIQVGRRPISIIVTQKRGPVEAPSQYLLRDHQARAQRTWQITPWLTEVLCVCACAMSLQLCLTLCDPMDCIACQAPLSMGFSGQEYWSGLPWGCHGVDIPFSRGSCQPRDQTCLSYLSSIGGWVLYCLGRLGSPQRVSSHVKFYHCSE